MDAKAGCVMAKFQKTEMGVSFELALWFCKIFVVHVPVERENSWFSLQYTKSVIYKSEQTAKSSSTSIIIERNAHLLVLYVYFHNITSPLRIWFHMFFERKQGDKTTTTTILFTQKNTWSVSRLCKFFKRLFWRKRVFALNL